MASRSKSDKYWLANNPNGQVTDAQVVALKSLSTADLDNVDAMVDELKAMTDNIPQAAEADVATYVEADIDSNAELVVVVNALGTKINNIIAKLEAAKILTA